MDVDCRRNIFLHFYSHSGNRLQLIIFLEATHFTFIKKFRKFPLRMTKERLADRVNWVGEVVIREQLPLFVEYLSVRQAKVEEKKKKNSRKRKTEPM